MQVQRDSHTIKKPKCEETEIGGSRVQGQPELYGYLKKKKKKKKKEIKKKTNPVDKDKFKLTLGVKESSFSISLVNRKTLEVDHRWAVKTQDGAQSQIW
jgi:hypothetical protein